MGMHWLDIAIITVISVSIITGLIRGFVKELIAITIWGLAIWLAYHYASSLDGYLLKWISEASIRYLVGFIAILLSTLVIGGVINALLALLMKKSGLSGTDRMLGMVFGFARGVFIVALGLVVLQMTSLSNDTQIKDSRLLAVFNPAVQWISSRVPQVLAKMNVLEKQSPLKVTMIPMDDEVSFYQENTSIMGNREKGNV